MFYLSCIQCPPLAAAIALKKESKKFKDADVYLEFDVIEVSATLGWNSGAVKKELKNLEWTSTSCGADGTHTYIKLYTCQQIVVLGAYVLVFSVYAVIFKISTITVSHR